MRVLRGMVYRMNSKGPRIKPWCTPYRENRVGKTDYQSSGHGTSEMISMI